MQKSETFTKLPPANFFGISKFSPCKSRSVQRPGRMWNFRKGDKKQNPFNPARRS